MTPLLRQRTEELLKKSPDETPALPTSDVQVLVHELQAYLTELERQNEELRRAQRNRAEPRDRYNELYQSVPVGCLTLDDDRIILDANAAAVAMLGVPLQGLVGQRAEKFVAQEDADACCLHLLQTAKTGNRMRKDIRFHRADGSLFWADLEAMPTHPRAASAALLISLRDVTSRKQTEEELRHAAAKLKAANAAQHDSHLAALNMMEDAVAAREEAEQACNALHASEERYRMLFTNLQEGFYLAEALFDDAGTCRDAVYLDVNPAFERIIGLPREQIVGKHAKDLVPQLKPQWLDVFGKVTRTGEAATYQAYSETFKKHFEAFVFRPMPEQFGVLVTDVTARVQAEERMRFQARLLDAVGQAVVSTDLSHRITYWNQAAATLFGWTHAEVQGRSLDEVTGSERPPDDESAFMAKFRQGETWTREMNLRRRDGTALPMLTTHAPVFDEQGNLTAIIGVGVDLTERKKTEDVLRFLGHCGTHGTGEGFFQELARYLAQALSVDFVCIDRLAESLLSAQTLAVFHNDRFEDNLSYTLKDTPCGEVVGQRICVFPRNVRGLFAKDALLQELRAESYLGTTLWSAQGKPIGLIAVIGRQPLEDTRLAESILQLVAVRAAGELERLQSERAITQLNAELEQRVQTRTAELAATNRELEAFCYTVSHDLRAPLRSMDGFSQALLEDYGPQLDATGRDFLHRVRSNCQRMARLIDDLLQLSRLTRAQMRLQPVDLTTLAQSVIFDLRQAEPDRAVDVRIAPGLTATGDPVLLRTALANLLENAWKFTSPRPAAVIEVGAMAADRALPSSGVALPSPVTFFVRDNGVGFDMQYAEKMFAPFQRLHATTDFPGSGIGLATVQRVIHRHGGRIWFESAPGQGATFYFMLGANG